MTQDLRRKTSRVSDSKGVSTIIGAIFFVLIVLLVASNVFMYILMKNAMYNQTVAQSRQIDADRFSERIAVSHGAYSVTGDKVRVDATLTNQGPVPVQILTLWAVDGTIKNYGFNDTIRSLNINLNPGDSLAVSGEVTIPGTEWNHRFNIWYVTARGNLIPFKKADEYVTISNMTYVMGPVLLNYQSLKWTSADGSSGTWNITKNKTVIEWSLSVTNFYDEDIRLSNNSEFSMYKPLGGPEQRIYWSLKEDYMLPVGQEVTITFQDKGIVLSTPGTYSTTITLIGKYASDRPYGQMFSFIAIEVVE